MTALCEHSQDLVPLSGSACWNRHTCKRSHSRILHLKYPTSGLLRPCCGSSTMLGMVEDRKGGQAPLCPQEVHGLPEARDMPAGQLCSRQSAVFHRHHHFGLYNHPLSEEPMVWQQNAPPAPRCLHSHPWNPWMFSHMAKRPLQSD